MYINMEQCKKLLPMVNKIINFLRSAGFSDIRIFEPFTEKQEGKINLLVKNDQKHDYYKISRAKYQLIKATGLEDIDFLVEENIDKNIKPSILSNAIELTETEIKKLFPVENMLEENEPERFMDDSSVTVEEDQDKFFVVIAIRKSEVNCEAGEIQSAYKDFTEKNIINLEGKKFVLSQ